MSNLIASPYTEGTGTGYLVDAAVARGCTAWPTPISKHHFFYPKAVLAARQASAHKNACIRGFLEHLAARHHPTVEFIQSIKTRLRSSFTGIKQSRTLKTLRTLALLHSQAKQVME